MSNLNDQILFFGLQHPDLRVFSLTDLLSTPKSELRTTSRCLELQVITSEITSEAAEFHSSLRERSDVIDCFHSRSPSDFQWFPHVLMLAKSPDVGPKQTNNTETEKGHTFG